VVVGSSVCETRGREQVWVKNPKLSCCGLVLGALGEMAVGDIVQGWGGDAYEVMRPQNMRQGVGLGQKDGNRAAVAQFQAR
jgi:hypothetical protein